MNKIQMMQFELMKLNSFNDFDGEHVVQELKAHSELWRGVVFLNLDNLIVLRDIEKDCWNADTVYILPQPGKEHELEELARGWKADTVLWMGGNSACRLLGRYGKEENTLQRQILRLTWE